MLLRCTIVQNMHRSFIRWCLALNQLTPKISWRLAGAGREAGLSATQENKALELLGKELGMFIDRKEVGAPICRSSGRPNSTINLKIVKALSLIPLPLLGRADEVME